MMAMKGFSAIAEEELYAVNGGRGVIEVLNLITDIQDTSSRIGEIRAAWEDFASWAQAQEKEKEHYKFKDSQVKDRM